MSHSSIPPSLAPCFLAPCFLALLAPCFLAAVLLSFYLSSCKSFIDIRHFSSIFITLIYHGIRVGPLIHLLRCSLRYPTASPPTAVSSPPASRTRSKSPPTAGRTKGKNRAAPLTGLTSFPTAMYRNLTASSPVLLCLPILLRLWRRLPHPQWL